MPVIIPFIVYAVATYAGYTALTVAILTLVSSLAVAEYEKRQAEADARAAYAASLQDRIIQERSGIAARGYVLGTVRLGGTLLYVQPIGAKGEALDQVVVFANNECSMVDWIVGDDFIDPTNFPGFKYGSLRIDPEQDAFTVTGTSASVILGNVPTFSTVHITWRQSGTTGTATGTIDSLNQLKVNITGLPSGSSDIVVSYQTPQADKLRGQFHPGTLTQTPTAWVGYPNSDWDTNHNLKGACYIRALYIWDQNVFQQGAPQVTAVLSGGTCDGFPFYDPRDGSHPATTTNPALLWAWWATLPRSMGGCGIPSDWINYTTVAAAANICDELVSVRTLDGLSFETIKRYECDTYLPTDVDPLSNLVTIESAMAGNHYFTANGQYVIFAGAFRPSIVTLTDSDVVGTKPFSLNSANIQEEPPNIVTATFVDATQKWVESSPVQVRNSQYVTDDGYENPLDLRLLATTDPRRARYLMGVALERGRPAFGVSCSIAGIGETLSLGDTVQLSLANRPQYAGRTFEIAEMTDNWDGTFTVSLQEVKSTTFALDPNSFTPVAPVNPVDNSYLWNPPAPTGFQIASISPTTLPDGTAVARVVLTWDPIPDLGNTPDAHFEIRYRTTGGDFIDGGSVPGDATSTTLTTALQDGEIYLFEIRFVNGIGAVSNWTDAYTGVAGVPLPIPQSLRLSASSIVFRVPQTGNPAPVSITLQAIRTGGLVAAATWSTSPTVNLGGSGDTRTLAYVDMGANNAVQVTLTVVQSSVTYVDKTTIVKVFDGADATKDLTAPPTPTGLAVTPFLVHLLVSWDVPTFTQGHAYQQTVIYAAQVTAQQPNPTFGNSTTVGSSGTTDFAFPAAPGTKWAFWIKWQSVDGVLSTTPAGGTNGVQGTTAQIGTVNLADGLVTAQQLADGTITAAKLAGGIIDQTKLASGLQAVRIVTGALPGTNVADVIYRTDDGKLYKWNGTTYTAAVLASDVQGQLTDAQLAAIAAAKITGTLTTTQIGPNTIQTGNLSAGSVTSAQIAADTITAANIAANAIGVSELAANSVTANAIAANAVTAGKIAAAAVNSQQIAAGAITTDKLLVTGRGAAINDDPAFLDATAWSLGGGNIATVSDGPVGTKVYRSASGINTDAFSLHSWPIDPAKLYRVSCWVRSAGANGLAYAGLQLLDSNGVNIEEPGGNTFWYLAPTGVQPPASWTKYSGTIGPGGDLTTPSAARAMQMAILGNYSGTTGFMEFQDLRVEEMIGSSLIVDGAITATKLAANSIAVGTAAIQTGAIVNAMIANAAIDSAKIIDLSVSTAKITDLAVSTLKIQDHAVTAPSFALLGSPVIVGNGDSSPFLSLTVVGSGAPLLILAACDSTGAGIELRRDGGALSQIFVPNAYVSFSGGFVPTMYVDVTSAGTHTYSLNCTLGSGFSDFVQHAAIFALELKK